MKILLLNVDRVNPETLLEEKIKNSYDRDVCRSTKPPRT